MRSRSAGSALRPRRGRPDAPAGARRSRCPPRPAAPAGRRRRPVAQFEAVELPAHDREGLQQQAHRVAGGRARRGASLMSTAITRSAPMRRAEAHRHRRDQTAVDVLPPADAAPAGRPPARRSTRARPGPVSPRRNSTASPLSRSVATMPSGRGMPLDRAPAGVAAHVARQRLAAHQRRGPGRPSRPASTRPWPLPARPAGARPARTRTAPPTRLPAEVPTTRSGAMPASSSTWITPMCAKPRAAPPPSARPMRGGFGGGGGDGAATTAAPSASIPGRRRLAGDQGAHQRKHPDPLQGRAKTSL